MQCSKGTVRQTVVGAIEFFRGVLDAYFGNQKNGDEYLPDNFASVIISATYPSLITVDQRIP